MQMEAVYRLTAHRVALHCIWQHSTCAVFQYTVDGILGHSSRAFWARAGRHMRGHMGEHMGGHTSVCQFHNWKSRASQLQCPAAGTPHICAWFV